MIDYNEANEMVDKALEKFEKDDPLCVVSNADREIRSHAEAGAQKCILPFSNAMSSQDPITHKLCSLLAKKGFDVTLLVDGILVEWGNCNRFVD